MEYIYNHPPEEGQYIQSERYPSPFKLYANDLAIAQNYFTETNGYCIESNKTRLQRIREDIARMGHPYEVARPGRLLPGLRDDVDTSAEANFTAHGKLGIHRADTGAWVTTATTEDLICVIDPRTCKPLTPGFTSIDLLTSEVMVGSVDTDVYVVSAEKPELGPRSYNRRADLLGQDPTLFYPPFFHAPELRISRLSEAQRKGLLKSADGQKGNIFGLEKAPSDELTERSEKLFQRTLGGIVAYAARDKRSMLELADPDTSVTLPVVATDKLEARANMYTSAAGDTVIGIVGKTDRSHERATGFYLVQDSSGAITVVDAGLNRSYTRSDEDYESVLEEADKQIELYFDSLKAQESSQVLTGETIHDMRRQLGTMSLEQAQRTVRQSLKPGSTSGLTRQDLERSIPLIQW